MTWDIQWEIGEFINKYATPTNKDQFRFDLELVIKKAEREELARCQKAISKL